MKPRPLVVVLMSATVVFAMSRHVLATLPAHLTSPSHAVTLPSLPIPPYTTTLGSCPGFRIFTDPPRDVYLSGLAGVYGGRRCGLVDPAGVQIMEAARWTAIKITRTNYIPGVSLGVNIYDTCGDEGGALRAGVSAVVEGGYLNPPHCRPVLHAALVSAAPHHHKLEAFLHESGVPWVAVSETSLMPHLEVVTPLLVALNWTSVAVVAPSVQVLREFGQLAAVSHICVSAEALLPDQSSGQLGYSFVMKSLEGMGGVVVVGPQHRIHALLVAAHAYNHTSLHWILVPTGHIQQDVFQGLNSVAAGLLAVRRAYQTVPEFGQHFLAVASSDTTLYPAVTHDDYVEVPGVFKMVEAVFRAGREMRRAVVEQCGGSRWCTNASITFTDPPPPDEPGVIETFSIKAQRPRYQVLRLDPGADARLTFTQVGHYTNGKLNLTAALLEGPGRPTQFPCRGCRCLNIRFSFLVDLKWRSEAWVTICATMAITGFFLALAIIVFISVRCCRGRAPEGSQGFSLFLLLGCIVLYAAILPYSFEASALTCGLRPFATNLAYALVLAIMLSRSIMLATSDSEGLVGHVSGVVQTALFFFMVTVQAGLGLQKWLMTHSQSFLSMQPPGGGAIYSCSEENPLHFLVAQSYIVFLLLLQLFVSPFIVCSRRNYQEGLLFFIATVFMAVIWVVWMTLYIILPPTWSEACVCLGLAATSTCLLITVFVPKTYLMVRAAARESKSLQPLTHPHSTHDVVTASSIGLYDSIGHLPEMMHAAPHTYGPDPTAHLPPRKENTYGTCAHDQPSPHKITRF